MQLVLASNNAGKLAEAAGIVIGVVIGSSKLAYDVAYPLLVGFSSIPKVAVVPIFVLWFGSGSVPAVLTAYWLFSASKTSSLALALPVCGR